MGFIERFVVGLVAGFIAGFVVGFVAGFAVGFVVGFVVGFAVGLAAGFIVGFKVDLKEPPFLFLEGYALTRVLDATKTLRISIYNDFTI